MNDSELDGLEAALSGSLGDPEGSTLSISQPRRARTQNSQAAGKVPSKAPTVAAEDSDLLSLDGDALSRAASRLGGAVAKALSLPRGEESYNISLSGDGDDIGPGSKTPSNLGGSRPGPGPLGTPPKPSPRGSDVGRASPALAGAAAPQPGKRSPAVSQEASYHSDEFASGNIWGESSSKSLPRSTAGGQPSPRQPASHRSPGAEPAPSHTPPPGSGSATPSKHMSTAEASPSQASRPTSAAGTPRRPSSAASVPAGSQGYSPAASLNGLPLPEATHSPYASRRGSLAGEGKPRARFQEPPPAVGAFLRSSQGKSRSADIPTPFELFRLYDNNRDGCVTHGEFIHMLRDLDALPRHFAPDEDPEELAEATARQLAACEAELARLQKRKQAAELQAQDGKDARERLSAAGRAVSDMEAHIRALQAKLLQHQEDAKRLAQLPAGDPERVDREVRQRRTEWRRFAEAEYRRADLGGNGVLGLDEFYMYYYGKLCFKFPVLATGANPGAVLFNIFVKYCSFGRGGVGGRNEDMLGHQFNKLCRDAKLLNDKAVTKATIDIIYHRARAADEALETFTHRAGVAATARMYYPQFLFALNMVAEKRRSGFQEVVARVLSAVETLPEASFSDFLLLSSNGLLPGEQPPELLTRPRRLPSNRHTMADNGIIAKMQQEAHDALALSGGLAPPPNPRSSLATFLATQKAGTPGADAAPASRRSSIASGTPDPASPAHVYGSPHAAAHAHAHAGGGLGSTVQLGSSGGLGTTGGDGTAGGGGGGVRRASVSGLFTKSVYGSLPQPPCSHDYVRSRAWEAPEPADLRASVRGSRALDSPGTLQAVRGLDPDALVMGLKRVFEAYNRWGGGVDASAMDKPRFHKVLRDARLVAESGPLPARKGDAIYDRVRPASHRTLNFIQFLEALRHVALAHRLALNEVLERLVAVGGPQREAWQQGQ